MNSSAEKVRDYVVIYLNGQRREIRGKQAFMTLSDYLRYERQMTGTKVVCAEGDCGACSVLVGSVKPNSDAKDIHYRVINACIQFMHGLDCAHVITVEGLPEKAGQLHPVQQAMVKAQGTQCGFCTPGFVMAAAGMMETKAANDSISSQQAKNYLTGNLCRCTGYQSIINAATSIETNGYSTIKARYHNEKVHADLLKVTRTSCVITHGNNQFHSPLDIDSAAAIKANSNSKVFAAATDLGVQYNKGHWHDQQVISLNLIPELHQIQHHPEGVKIGARVTLTDLEQALVTTQPEWAEFMHVFASPQIKNNATLVGNIANGSPIGDNLPFLLAINAKLTLQSLNNKRVVDINDFYLGYRKLDLAAGEIITFVEIPNKPPNSFLKLYKASQRRDLDISCVAAAFMLGFDGQDKVQTAAIALGGVAATTIRVNTIEQSLIGLSLDQLIATKDATAQQLAEHIKPMSDVRGSESYRKLLVANLYKKFIDELQQSREAQS